MCRYAPALLVAAVPVGVAFRCPAPLEFGSIRRLKLPERLRLPGRANEPNTTA